MIRTTRRYWWLGLVMVAAMVVGIPTALAQGPVTGSTGPAFGTGGESSCRDCDDGTLAGRLQYYIAAPDSGFSWHPEITSANDLAYRLGLHGWTGVKWTWANAWEEDFKRTSLGGNNNNWADDKDFAFYVGHGSPSSFTFNGTHDDYWLTPADAYLAWGDKDLEWVGLLSCSVLADSNRDAWAWTMNGLHLLMGFKTAASAGYPGFGGAVANAINAGYTMGNAWWYACDTQQGTSNYARILGEDWWNFNEYPYGARQVDTWDNTYWWWDHQCGSEYPRAAAPLAGTAMPVFLTPPLNLAEQAQEWGSLTTAFGLPPQGSSVMASGTMSGTTANGRELTMDLDSGQFYYIDHNNLFTVTNPVASAQSVQITPGQAQAIATFFLTSTGLMPPDAQAFEVAVNQLGEVSAPGRAMGIQAGSQQILTATTDYSVIYSRILTYTTTNAMGAQAVQEYSVGGPGAKMKVYVNPTGAAASGASTSVAAATDVIGAQGGWTRVNNNPMSGSVQPMAAVTETVLDYPTIVQLFTELEKRVALATTELPNPTSRNILANTVFYWEEAVGIGQSQLFPAYDLTVEYSGLQAGELVTFTDHSYIPAAPQYMRPYAEILDKDVFKSSFRPGEALHLEAADATLPLSSLGHDQLLNFVLGTGAGHTYFYQWVLNTPDGEVILQDWGLSRTLDWTVDPSVLGNGKGNPVGLSITLNVQDTESTHTSQNTSSDVVSFNVGQPLFMPLVVKGF